MAGIIDTISGMTRLVVEPLRRPEGAPKETRHYVTDAVVDGTDAVRSGYNAVADGLGKANDWVRSNPVGRVFFRS